MNESSQDLGRKRHSNSENELNQSRLQIQLESSLSPSKLLRNKAAFALKAVCKLLRSDFEQFN